MSDFWVSFADAAESIVEGMGEEVFIGGRPMKGVVEPVEVKKGIVSGGVSSGVTHAIQVNLNDGNEVADGEKVESRMLKGAVISKVHFGGGWVIHAGPVNRWKEDDFG